MKTLDPTAQTLVGSAWMVSRWLTFWFLGATLFWHTRPRLLLVATFGMGVAFVGVTAPLGLASMIAFQVLLGASLGLIYTASLYRYATTGDAGAFGTDAMTAAFKEKKAGVVAGLLGGERPRSPADLHRGPPAASFVRGPSPARGQ